MNAPAIFAGRTVAGLVAVGCLSFLAAVALIVAGEDLFPSSTVDANAFSESAIGHKAFIETLQRLGIRVLVSRSDSAAKATPDDLVIVAEPPVARAEDAYLRQLLQAPNVLLVLPKWLAAPEFANRRWAGEVERLPVQMVDELLQAAAPAANAEALQGSVTWKPGRFDTKPTLDDPQLMESQRLRPLVDSDQGMLLGSLTGVSRHLWILSDPDLLSNHGLKRGDNAALAVGIVEAALPAGGTVIVDEVIHGFRRDPNLWRSLLEFPFVFVTLNALATVAILVWAATGRFGAPVPIAAPLKAGKTTLIGNAAGLLRHGGHGGAMLRRYLAVTFGDVARRVHAPADLADATLADWLGRIGKVRQVGFAPAVLQAEAEAAATTPADERRLLQAARNLHRWKQEMLHGPGDDSSGRRTSETGSAQGGRRPGGGH